MRRTRNNIYSDWHCSMILLFEHYNNNYKARLNYVPGTSNKTNKPQTSFGSRSSKNTRCSMN